MDLTEAEDIKKKWQEFTTLPERSSRPRESRWCVHSPIIRHPRIWSQVDLSITTKKLVEVMGFQWSFFKFWKMMLWKFCTQHASKFGKFCISDRIGKGQFSFHSQRKTMPKNVQTMAQLHSFHMLSRLCSKSFKLGFSSRLTENFQMY